MNFTGFYTLFAKEILRFRKVWLQTLMAPIVTALLYLLVFGHVLQGRIEVFPGVGYLAFLVPGLVMMSVIQNAFANSSTSLIQSKVSGSLVFMLLAPLSHLEFFAAFVAAAVVRGIAVGLGVYLVAVMFVPVPVAHPWAMVLFAVLGSAMAGTLGVIAGLWAEKFDQLAGFQNFVILPLSFLSGVFYSIRSLPPFWQGASHLNPFFYMIDGFRYGFFGQADTHPGLSLLAVGGAFLLLAAAAVGMIRRGYKLRE